MDMQQEMMNDAMDAGMDNYNDEEEADKVYSQICDEIGVDINEEQQVNKKAISVSNPAQSSNNTDDLQARLDQLKR